MNLGHVLHAVVFFDLVLGVVGDLHHLQLCARTKSQFAKFLNNGAATFASEQVCW